MNSAATIPGVKLYVWNLAPNPRRVTMFLAEKGLSMEMIEVGQPDLTLAAWYREKYPHALVPMLELADGTCIGEAMAICRYIEDLYPEPRLFGADPRERALVGMWESIAYSEGLIAVAEVFRNTHPAFAGRGVPGTSQAVPQIPQLAERGRARSELFFRKLDGQLTANAFIAGANFSVADITAFCTIDFARTGKIGIPEDCGNLRRWYGDIKQRPCAAVR